MIHPWMYIQNNDPSATQQVVGEKSFFLLSKIVTLEETVNFMAHFGRLYSGGFICTFISKVLLCRNKLSRSASSLHASIFLK